MLFRLGSQVDSWESREKTEEGGRKIQKILGEHLVSRSFLALSFEAFVYLCSCACDSTSDLLQQPCPECEQTWVSL